MGNNVRVIETIKSKVMDKFQMSDKGDVSPVRGVPVNQDCERGTLTITREDYTISILARFGKEHCTSMRTSGFGSELCTEQPARTIVSRVETLRYQEIRGSILYIAQILLYAIKHASCQLTRPISKPANVNLGAAKHHLWYLAETTAFSITYKRVGYMTIAFSDAN